MAVGQSEQGLSAKPDDSQAGRGQAHKQAATEQPAEVEPIRFEVAPVSSAISIHLGEHFVLSPGGLVQFRSTQNHRQDPPNDKNLTSAFTVPRTRLWLHLRATRWFRAFVRFGALANGNVQAEYAWIDLVWRGLSLRGGRLQLPLFVEDFYMPHYLTAIDYSTTNHVFSQGASQGAMLSYTWRWLQAHAAVTDGLRTGFSEVASPEIADFAVTGRLWALAIGDDWDSFGNLSSPSGTPLGLRVGAAIHYQSYSETTDRLGQDLLYSTADVTFKYHRLSASLFGVLAWSKSSDGLDRVDWGLVSYLSGFVLTWLELWTRFDAVFAESAPPLVDPSAANRTDFRTVAGGINFYLLPPSNRLRVQIDFQYMFDPQDTSIVTVYKAGGVLASSERQWALRTQIAAAF